MTSIINQLVNAIAEDLRDLVPDPPTGLELLDWRYIPPDALSADNAPWLAVYSPTTTYELVATPDQYDRRHLVTVEWAISIASEAELGGFGSPALASAAIDDFEALRSRMETYASGVPGFDNQKLATMTDGHREMGPGLAFRQSVELSIEQMPS